MTSSGSYLSNNDEESINLASNNPKKRAGRRKFHETRHPVYRGVRRRNSNWVCEVRKPNSNSRIWLGTFPTLEMAARAHDVAAIALRGKSACLNFADSAWRLPIPASSNTKDIQNAAAEAAKAFRPRTNDHVSLSEEATSTVSTVDSSENNINVISYMQTEPTDEEISAITTMELPENKNVFSLMQSEHDDQIMNSFMNHDFDHYDQANLFGMHDHSLFAGMAEGLMVPPLPEYNDDVVIYADMSLWSF